MKKTGVRMLILMVWALLLPVAASAQKGIAKEAKKQAKALKAEGWTTPNGQDLEAQLTECLTYELAENPDFDATERYITGSGSQTASNLRMGIMAAKARAQGEIVRKLKSQVMAIYDTRIENQQTDSATAQSRQQFEARLEMKARECISGAFDILVLNRQTDSGAWEVQVRMAMKEPIIEITELINNGKD